jgi:ribosomal protein S12 methylthiotransferase accessory factor
MLEPEHVIDDETGIVRWVAEIPREPGEPEIFNYSTQMCDTSVFLPVQCHNSNGGASLTQEGAFRAAVGEAVERYCCSVFDFEHLPLSPYTEVSSDIRALGPSEVTLFHPRQRNSIRYSWFTEETRLRWAQGHSLTTQEPVLVPACMVYIPYAPARDEGEESIGPSISTGQASGFDLDSALLRGICEVVERDAFSLGWLNRLPLPELDIESNPKVSKTYHGRFARRNLEYRLYQMITDLPIPAVLCLVVDHATDPPMICTGGAASPDPIEATLKALIEAAQTREWAKFMGKQPKPTIVESDYSNITDFEKHVFLYAYGDMMEAVEFLFSTEAKTSISDLPNLAGSDEKSALERVVAEIARVGHEVLYVDLTTLDVEQCGYRVVKVFIPGMQPLEGDHTHRFLGGHRLYELPVKLGLLATSSIDTLNPYPHPYP